MKQKPHPKAFIGDISSQDFDDDVASIPWNKKLVTSYTFREALKLFMATHFILNVGLSSFKCSNTSIDSLRHWKHH